MPNQPVEDARVPEPESVEQTPAEACETEPPPAGRLHLAFSANRTADVARLAVGVGAVRTEEAKPLAMAAAAGAATARVQVTEIPVPPQPAPEPVHPSLRSRIAILSRKRIAAIGFAPQESSVVERSLQAHFALVDGMRLSQVSSDGANLNHLDLLIVRAGEDAEAADFDMVCRLALRGFPVLVAGPRSFLGSLVACHRHGLVDFINEPWDSDELLWRAAGLLERAQGRRRRGAATDKLRVLVADDDAITRALLAATLERCGMECTVVDHGSAAIEAIRQDPPHVVIMEVVMPGLDGFQVLAELKRSPELASLPVIMLSLRQSEPDVLRGFGLGADDYVTKPFSPMEVAARVRRVVERAS